MEDETFECPICGQEYDNQEDADSCCEDNNEEENID